MNFIRRHFKGEYPLGTTFCFTFLGLTAGYHFLEPFVRKPFIESPVVYTSIAITYLVITRLIVYPWQITGLLRSLEKYHAKTDNGFVLYTVQIIIVVSLAWTIFHVVTVAQILIYYKKDVEFYSVAKKTSYSLALADNGQLLHLVGVIDFGVTKKVTEALVENKDITGIILDSDGGQIYEGRGLAMLIDKNGLDTYTYKGCSSSCATAFIGGKKRYLGKGAKLGFHHYKIDPERSRQTSPTYDLKTEEKKDLALFRSKNLKPRFLEKMFQSTEMWFPDPNELFDAGVIHGVVEKISLEDEVVWFNKLNRD